MINTLPARHRPVSDSDQKRPRLLVAGGGPAGLMAAGQAALAGVDVVVLEKMPRPGRKLCITGKGRCNLTNVAPLPDFLGHFGPTGSFLRQAFHRFFTPELLGFFEDLGLTTITERGGRVFPASGKAPEVLAALERWLRQCGVTIRGGHAIERVCLKDGRGDRGALRGRRDTRRRRPDPGHRRRFLSAHRLHRRRLFLGRGGRSSCGANPSGPGAAAHRRIGDRPNERSATAQHSGPTVYRRQEARRGLRRADLHRGRPRRPGDPHPEQPDSRYPGRGPDGCPVARPQARPG
jgi:Predicted flavoproteins